MNCPACQRANQSGRRYCGGCGCNFVPACDACGFANERTDRFCGGCGQALRVAAAAERSGGARPSAERVAGPPAIHAPAVPAGSQIGSAWDPSELAALFTTTAPAEDLPELPETGISQSDVDRLFGGAS